MVKSTILVSTFPHSARIWETLWLDGILCEIDDVASIFSSFCKSPETLLLDGIRHEIDDSPRNTSLYVRNEQVRDHVITSGVPGRTYGTSVPWSGRLEWFVWV